MNKKKIKLTAVISSTALDLPEHRQEVMNACLEQDLFPKMMEHLPASPDDAVNASKALVEIADVYIGIIGFRYGYVPDGYEISITEMEYDHAGELGVPRLMFLMHDEHPVKKSGIETGPGARKIEAFRNKIKKDQVGNFFKSPAHLKALVLNSLSQFLKNTTNKSLFYDTAIVEMIHPAQNSFGAMMNQFEPYPAFPYFSHESDHPSQWPPRVFEDRTAFAKLIAQKLSGKAETELLAWKKKYPPKIKTPGIPEHTPSLNYTQLRLFLTENDQRLDIVEQFIGPACAIAIVELENVRQQLEQNVPNRLLILKVVNNGEEDIANFSVEMSVNGAIYDITVNSIKKSAKYNEYAQNRFSVDIPLLSPGYKADLRVWYYYQPLAAKVFPGPMDLKWEQTQGIVIENLSASGVRIAHSAELLESLEAYHCYATDPVRNSPTFGKLDLPLENDGYEDEENVSDEPEENLSCFRVSVPEKKGPYALFLYLPVSEIYRQKNDAQEAQILISNALYKFYEDLKIHIAEKNGNIFYELEKPVESSYSKFSGEYFVSGSLTVIVRIDSVLDFIQLAGLDILKYVTTINADYIEWHKAKYEVVLQFYSDKNDSAKDSKRVLTNTLGLDDIFHIDSNANKIAPGFKRLLEYTRYCLMKYYKKDFMLEQDEESSSVFYIVARNKYVSENIDLPKSWEKIEIVKDFKAGECKTLAANLSRLYDYANQSRELSKSEFEKLFH